MSNQLHSHKIFLTMIMVIVFFHLHSMNYKSHLLYPEEYGDFRLTRSYGKSLQSNFDCLPKDILESFIKSYLSQLIIDKFKKKILKHTNYVNNVDNTIYQETIACKAKAFQYHDGRYNVVPDIADYNMWDGDNEQSFIDAISTKQSLVSNWVRLAFHNDTSSDILLLIPIENYFNNNTRFFKIAATKNSNTQVKQIFCEKNITSYLFSYDGNWLSLSNPGESNKVILIDINTNQLIEYIFNDSLMTINVAHSSPLFVVGKQKHISFIIPEGMQKKIEVNFRPKFTQFSPNDKYLLVCGNKKIALCDVSNIQTKKRIQLRYAYLNFPIQKAFFSPDSKIIVVALKNGNLFFWNDFFNTVPTNLSNSFWKKNENQDNTNPVILWSKDSQLLFSLVPVRYQNSSEYSFMVRNTKNGKMLLNYAFDENHPTAMGLTKDEKTIVFTDKQNSLWKFDLYNEKDRVNIDFICKKANVYQLCYLWNQVKKIKEHQSLKNFQSFIKGIKS